MAKKFVISLGGSVLVPDQINTKLLREFCLVIKKEVKRRNKFVIIVGGGGLCRQYQKAATEAVSISTAAKDWLGIAVTHLNAQLLKTCLTKAARPEILTEPQKDKGFSKYPVIVGGGWKPGWSTDFVAIQAAVNFKISRVINLSDIPYVYTANPKKDRAAKPIKQLSWAQYFKVIPSRWTPGLNTPFDPMAARLAQKRNIEVIVADGRNLKNFKSILAGKKFKGTTIG